MMLRVLTLSAALLCMMTLAPPAKAQSEKAASDTLQQQQQSTEVPAFDEEVEVDEYPVPITRVSPVYPEEAKKKFVEGMVLVKVLVGTDGVPKDTKIMRSVSKELDAAAVAAIMQWRFQPATFKGKPVFVWVLIPMQFSITND